MLTSPQMVEALKRAALSGFIYTMLALGALLAVPESRNVWTILSVCLVTFFGPLGVRGYLEGWKDTSRDERGDIQPSDVGSALIDDLIDVPPKVRAGRPPSARD